MGRVAKARVATPLRDRETEKERERKRERAEVERKRTASSGGATNFEQVEQSEIEWSFGDLAE